MAVTRPGTNPGPAGPGSGGTEVVVVDWAAGADLGAPGPVDAAAEVVYGRAALG